MALTTEEILRRDAQLTAFKLACVNAPEPKTKILEIIAEHYDISTLSKERVECLERIGYDAIRRPHRIPA